MDSLYSHHLKVNIFLYQRLSIHEAMGVRAAHEPVVLILINLTQNDGHTAPGYTSNGVVFLKALCADAEVALLSLKGSLKHGMRVVEIEEGGLMCQCSRTGRVICGSCACFDQLILRR